MKENYMLSISYDVYTETQTHYCFGFFANMKDLISYVQEHYTGVKRIQIQQVDIEF